jgi:hypothetical protein
MAAPSIVQSKNKRLLVSCDWESKSRASVFSCKTGQNAAIKILDD